MLTYNLPNGDWCMRGVNFDDVPAQYYGYMCRIREYEKTGLEPYQIEDLKFKVAELEAEVEKLKYIISNNSKGRRISHD